MLLDGVLHTFIYTTFNRAHSKPAFCTGLRGLRRPAELVQALAGVPAVLDDLPAELLHFRVEVALRAGELPAEVPPGGARQETVAT